VAGLSGGEKLANGVIRLLSTKETYGEARALAADLNNMLRHYIRAKVILAVLSLAYCSIAMLFLGYRHALALGLMAGLLEFIPVAGWITALTIIATVGLIMHAHWIWMAALLGSWRVTMDYWIGPACRTARDNGLFHSSCGACIQSVADGCMLQTSSYTPSAAPAMGDGSCAARHASRRPSMTPRVSAI
jgi:hypothetical protein